MTNETRKSLADGLDRLSADVAILAALLRDIDTTKNETEPAEVAEPPTMEELRAALSEKARSGFRAEVKALLTKHGAKQLADVKDPRVMAIILKEAEAIGNG